MTVQLGLKRNQSAGIFTVPEVNFNFSVNEGATLTPYPISKKRMVR
jgi:hypothetical protein